MTLAVRDLIIVFRVVPVLDLDFVNKRYRDLLGRRTVPEMISVSRADGVARVLDASDNWQLAQADTLRIDAISTGLRVGPSRQCIAKWNRDGTNAVWIKSNLVAVKDQVGVDGTANSASRLTATANDATFLQSITSGSSARTFAVWVKRLTGSGAVYMTLDNGSTWSDTTAQFVSGKWAPVRIPTQTVTNPVCGIKLATSGDEIAFDAAMLTAGIYPSSPFFTTSASVTQPSDAPYVDLGSLLARFDVNSIQVLIDFTLDQIENGGAGTMASLVNSASPTTQRMTINFSGTSLSYGLTVVGASQGYDPQGANVSLGPHRWASTWDAVAKLIAVAVDGQFSQVGAPTSFPSGIDRIHIGHQNDVNHLGGRISRLRLFAGYSSIGDMLNKSAAA